MMFGRALLLCSDRGERRRLARWLEERGHAVAAHGSGDMALAALHAEAFDVAVVVEGDAPASFLRRMSDERPDVPVASLRRDDDDDRAVRRAFELRRQARALRRLPAPRQPGDFREVIGSSAAVLELRHLLSRLAVSDAPVLVLGETGTGKELVARLLHAHGPRREAPFVAVNCAAIPVGLLESELFGHERGAFTSAVAARFGLFATANGGTLLLDEIQSLPLGVQPKLLKVLEDRCVRPLGSGREVPFDVRLTTASNVSLRHEVDAGRFREDLLHRIDVLRVWLPPLRHRGTDVLELADRFLAEVSARTGAPPLRLAPAAAERLLAYRWPGNVRELRHVIEAAALMATAGRIEVADLPEELRQGRPRDDGEEGDLPTLHELQRRHARGVLAAMSGNKRAAASVLGISRQRLYRLLQP